MLSLQLEGVQDSVWVYLLPLLPLSQSGDEVSAITYTPPPWTVIIIGLFLCLMSLSGKKALFGCPGAAAALFPGFCLFQLQSLLSLNLSMGKEEKSAQSSAGVSVPFLSRL